MEPRVERAGEGVACQMCRMVAHLERKSFCAHRPQGACTEEQVIPVLGERGGMCAIAAHPLVCL